VTASRTRALVVGAILAGSLLVGCGGSSDASDPGGGSDPVERSAAGPTSTSAAAGAAASAAPDMQALRGLRYCEVLLLRKGDDGFRAEVWNTMGMSDCPADAWQALDADEIARDRGAVAAILNGPRYWTLDSIETDLRAGAPETSFGEIGMFQAATVALGDDLPTQTPYTERPVARETVFGFDEGSEIYELVAPDGTTYVMQARSQIVDPDLEESDLVDLGDRLDLPAGWRYQVRTLDEPLDLRSADGVATVVQDDLQNTYQRIDRA